ncbi:MAG TPA: hypothetical protein EYP34_09870 [Chromatiaceae bacterium]|nr:hypothetical protein [Chromatiaceae bacterium]
MLRMRRMMLAGLMLLVSQSHAAGVATLQSGHGQQKVTITVEYDDQNRVRMNMPQNDEGSGFMLAKDGKVWIVVDVQGQTMVMDVAQMAAMGSANNDDTLVQEFISAKPTGEKQTVAGFSGEVYELTWNDKGKIRTDKVVLSKDPVVVEYSNAWLTFAESMEKKVKNSIGQHFRKAGLGLLKMGDEFQVVSIRPGKVNGQNFVLPTSTMQMPPMGR